MPTPYNVMQWFWPPRTKARLPWGDDIVLPIWRNFPDVVAQYKLDGNRNMIFVSPERKVTFWNRKLDKVTGQPYQQNYEIQTPLLEKILAIAPDKQWTVFDSELMHTKGGGYVKNTIYLYDVLVWQSQHLQNTSYNNRYQIIENLGLPILPLLGKEASQVERGAIIGNNNIYLAQNILPADWDKAWKQVRRCDFIEGLVLKRTGPISNLEYGSSEYNNSGWMVRVRKAKKNYVN
jgi:ATP-dependent DNA ligase